MQTLGANGSGHNTFRGTGEDWNALASTAQVKQSVDSLAVSVNGTNARNAGQMHQTFRKGRYRQIASQNPGAHNQQTVVQSPVSAKKSTAERQNRN